MQRFAIFAMLLVASAKRLTGTPKKPTSLTTQTADAVDDLKQPSLLESAHHRLYHSLQMQVSKSESDSKPPLWVKALLTALAAGAGVNATTTGASKADVAQIYQKAYQVGDSGTYEYGIDKHQYETIKPYARSGLDDSLNHNRVFNHGKLEELSRHLSVPLWDPMLTWHKSTVWAVPLQYPDWTGLREPQKMANPYLAADIWVKHCIETGKDTLPAGMEKGQHVLKGKERLFKQFVFDVWYNTGTYHGPDGKVHDSKIERKGEFNYALRDAEIEWRQLMSPDAASVFDMFIIDTNREAWWLKRVTKDGDPDDPDYESRTAKEAEEVRDRAYADFQASGDSRH